MDEDTIPPSLPWRASSTTIISIIGTITRAFMHGLNTQEGHGHETFMRLLDERADISTRQRGLVTVSNHISMYPLIRDMHSLDDPLTWGILPFRHHFNPSNHRWTLGSYDIVFKNKALSSFFSLGQVLPTHRLHHSPYGGPFQPTMREAVRLLSQPPFTSVDAPTEVDRSLHSPDISDPFSSPNHAYTYTTNGIDTFPCPSAYATRQYSWIHIFPEGRVHQHPRKTMRYFKWGVARLILEPDVCPDIVPMWIEGHNEIYPEDRGFPRFLPRIGKQCSVWFGQNVGGEREGVFQELRRKWRRLVEDKRRTGDANPEIGVLTDELKYGAEAEALRAECARQIRRQVLEVRRLRGLPDEDPKEELVETWKEEGGKREGRMDDGSLVKDT